MKIRFNRVSAGIYGVANVGDEIELNEKLAKELVKAGIAHEVELHAITEQDIELNPELKGQVEVGEVVELGPIVSPEEAEQLAEEVKEEQKEEAKEEVAEPVEEKAEDVKEEGKEEEIVKEKVEEVKPLKKNKKAGPSK